MEQPTPNPEPTLSEKIAPYAEQGKLAIAKAHAWVFQDAHKERAREIKDQVERAFTEHPQDTGETYSEHLLFTIKMTGRLLYSSTVLMIHGLLPFLCTRTASMQIEKIYGIMRSRIPQSRRDEINRSFDI